MDQSIHTVTIPVGTLAGSLVMPLMRVPSSDCSFGGITITGAYFQTCAAATSGFQLLYGTATGTAHTGTIGTLNGTMAANVQQAFTVSTAYVSSGYWILIKLNAGSASMPAVGHVTLEYKWGK